MIPYNVPLMPYRCLRCFMPTGNPKEVVDTPSRPNITSTEEKYDGFMTAFDMCKKAIWNLCTKKFSITLLYYPDIGRSLISGSLLNPKREIIY